MIVIRPLTDADFQRLPEIDHSEHITLIYRLVDGELRPEATFGSARLSMSNWPGWPPCVTNWLRGWRN
jgi:hypothetical protein